jgi:DNA-binding NtrC family response regulator
MPMDLVISDERMPGMAGLEVLDALRRAGWPTPFILITGFGDQATHASARRLGASAVFDKPFDLDDLRKTVLQLLVPDDPPLGRPAPSSRVSEAPSPSRSADWPDALRRRP